MWVTIYTTLIIKAIIEITGRKSGPITTNKKITPN